eukprot:6736937-Pyramimonas_sp.AAC.1
MGCSFDSPRGGESGSALLVELSREIVVRQGGLPGGVQAPKFGALLYLRLHPPGAHQVGCMCDTRATLGRQDRAAV